MIKKFVYSISSEDHDIDTLVLFNKMESLGSIITEDVSSIYDTSIRIEKILSLDLSKYVKLIKATYGPDGKKELFYIADSMKQVFDTLNYLPTEISVVYSNLKIINLDD